MYENYGWKYVVTALVTALFSIALYMNGLNLGLDLMGGVELLYKLDPSKAPAGKADFVDQAVEILGRRLDELAIKELSIRKQGTQDIVIQVPGGTATDTQNIRNTIERAGKLDFKLVVTDKQGFSEGQIRAEVARIYEAKKNSAYDPKNDRFDIAVAKEAHDAGTVDYEGQRWYLLEVKGVSGSLLTDAGRTQDEMGRPAVSFTFGAEGRKQFYDMTSANVNRPMAIVLDDNAMSAPVIHSAIGEHGQITGGQGGFTEEQVKSLVAVLKSGPLPVKPEFQYEQKVGASLGLYAIKMGIIATVASMALVLLFMVVYYKVGGAIANIALALNILLLLGVLAAFGATLTIPGIAGILLTAGMAVDANILIFERMREEHERGAALKQAIELGYDRAFWTIFDSHVTTLVTGFVLFKVGTGPIRGFAVTLMIGVAISLFTALVVTKIIYGWLGSHDKLPQINFMKLFSKPNFDFMGAYPKAVIASLVLINVGFLVFLIRGSDKYGIDFTGGTVVQMRLRSPMEKVDIEKRVGPLAKEVEVQRVGEREQGGTDKGLEFQIRTREFGEKKLAAAGGEKKVGALPLPELLPRAYGDDTTAPKKDGAPADGAPVDTKTPAKDDRPSMGAPPAPPEIPAEQPATSEEKTDAASLFATKLQDAFKAELIEGYPAIDGVKPGQGYVEEDAGADRKKLRFLVNLLPVPQPAGGFSDPNAAMVASRLPDLLKAEAASIVKPDMTAQMKKELLATLAAEAPVAKDVAARGERVKTIEITTPAVPAGKVKDAWDAVRRGVERSKDWAVADPFPRRDQIGGAVAKNLKSKAYISMFLAVIAIVIYVAFRFDFVWGIGAIIALAHDVLTTIGFVSIVDFTCAKLGVDFDAKFNLPTVAAFLTLIGYSIADTIVVYDRIREAIRLKKQTHPDAAVINDAINGTLSRTILTSLTVFLVALVLFICSFFGLKVIQGFSAAMCFGVITGTYSSVFIAAPVIISPPKQTAKLLGIELAGLIVAGILVWALHLAS